MVVKKLPKKKNQVFSEFISQADAYGAIGVMEGFQFFNLQAI